MPVLACKNKPGFLAKRLQHALAREAFAMIDEGIATPEDVAAAVRFGFGFRYLAAGLTLLAAELSPIDTDDSTAP